MVELLVVIAVIGILAALLLPALSRAKHKAWNVVCLNNERQMTLKFLMHLDDGAQYLKSEELGIWYAEEFGATNNGNSLCPEAPYNFKGWLPFDSIGEPGTIASAWRRFIWQPGPDTWIGETRISSYSCNYNLIAAAYAGPVQPTIAGGPAFRSEDQIMHPAATPLLADGVSVGVSPATNDLPSTDLVNGGLSFEMGSLTIPRHGGRPNPVPTNWPVNQRLPGAVNAALFDGHVETVKLERLWQLYWRADWVPPAFRPGL